MLIDGVSSANITTQAGLIMLMIMGRMTDTIVWEEKVWNDEMTNKWRAELVNDHEASGNDEMEGVEKDEVDEWKSRKITNEMVDWVSFL